MTKNPLINALAATLYIVVIVLVLDYTLQRTTGPTDELIIPMVMLALFTLSAAVMGYLFAYQPLRLYIDGKKQVAVNLFLQTLAVFAGITVLAFIIVLVTSSPLPIDPTIENLPISVEE